MMRHLVLQLVTVLSPEDRCLRRGSVSLAFLLLTSIPACRSASEPQIYTVRGVVKQVQQDQKRVKIDHEEIPGFMEAMTMEFEVRDPAILTGLRPEDPVVFTLEHTPGSLYLVGLEPAGGAGSQTEQRPASPAQHAQDTGLNTGEPLEFSPFPAPDFHLTDQDGQPFALSSLHGKVVLMDFIFTQCPGPCPMLSTKFRHVQRRLGKRLGTQVMLLSVTIDPRRDTPDVLKAYAKRYQADLSGWKFLTGSTRDILVVATQYGAEYQGGSEGIVDHRLLTCVIDQEGMLVEVFDGVNYTVDELLAAIEQLLT